jgi:hypothetical protein
MSSSDWGSAEWQDAQFPKDQLDGEGDAWGIRWRGMERLRHESYLRLIDKRLQKSPPQKLLDIGCALCDFTEKAWNSNAKNLIFGMDISPTAVSWSSRKFPEFSLKVAELPRLPFEENFDGVFCLEVLCYLSPEDRKQTIANIAQALDSNCWLIFSGVLGAGEKYHTEEEVIALLSDRFEVSEKEYNYWWLYRNSFEGPFERLRSRLQELDSVVTLSDEQLQARAATNQESGLFKLGRALHTVSFIAHPVLRFSVWSLKSLLASKSIAVVMSKIAYWIGGKDRADEIIIVADLKNADG